MKKIIIIFRKWKLRNINSSIKKINLYLDEALKNKEYLLKKINEVKL